MRISFPRFVPIAFVLCLSLSFFGYSTETASLPSSEKQTPAVIQVTPVRPFSAKILKERVRLRLQPSLDSAIFQEMGKGDLLIVTGEKDDFYAVKPPSYTPAYVFRTYILDDVVEGSHVNVRMQPDLESPILAQLNSGDAVHGQICPDNPKWLKITAPDSVRLYIYKDYVENIGDETVFARVEKRKEEVNRLLETALLEGKEILQRHFEEIDLHSVQAKLLKVANEYGDFPEHVAEAKKELSRLHEGFLEKKISYLENETQSSKSLVHRNKQLSVEMLSKQERIHHLEQELRKREDPVKEEFYAVHEEPRQDKQDLAHTVVRQISPKMLHWVPLEEEVYNKWLEEHEGNSKEAYLLEQQEFSVTLAGILEIYDRPVKNKPGDYVLLNPNTHLPICYLYSTKVDLEKCLGQKVMVEANARPNRHFAYPAYHVLAMN